MLTKEILNLTKVGGEERQYTTEEMDLLLKFSPFYIV